MASLLETLQAVHDEITAIMAESRLDSLTRQKLANQANEISDVLKKLSAAMMDQKHQKVGESRILRSLARKAMDLLAQIVTSFYQIE